MALFLQYSIYDIRSNKEIRKERRREELIRWISSYSESEHIDTVGWDGEGEHIDMVGWDAAACLGFLSGSGQLAFVYGIILKTQRTL